LKFQYKRKQKDIQVPNSNSTIIRSWLRRSNSERSSNHPRSALLTHLSNTHNRYTQNSTQSIFKFCHEATFNHHDNFEIHPKPRFTDLYKSSLPPVHTRTSPLHSSSLLKNHTLSTAIHATMPSPSTENMQQQKQALTKRLSAWWSHVKPLIAAKTDLDEQYNFASGHGSSWGGRPYNFPDGKRRGEQD